MLFLNGNKFGKNFHDALSKGIFVIQDEFGAAPAPTTVIRRETSDNNLRETADINDRITSNSTYT